MRLSRVSLALLAMVMLPACNLIGGSDGPPHSHAKHYSYY